MKNKNTNLGYKDEPIEVERRSKIRYPSFYVRKELPISKEDIGKTFNVTAKIKCTGMNQDMDTNKTNYNYNFDVISIKF